MAIFFTRQKTFVTYCFLYKKNIFEKNLLKKERICSKWSKFFPFTCFRVEPFTKGYTVLIQSPHFRLMFVFEDKINVLRFLLENG